MSRSKYTKAQIQFVMNLKKRGKTYSEIAQELAKRFGLKATVKSVETLFRRYKDDYDLDGLKSHVEIKSEVMEDRILRSFLDLVNERMYVPIQAEFVSATEFSSDQVRRYYGSFEDLEQKARQTDPKVFKNIIDIHTFTDKEFKALREDVSKYKRFIITTAVTGCEIHEEAMAAIQTYCKTKKAKMLVLACSDPAHTKDRKYNFSLDHRIPNSSVVFRDLNLNNNLFISTIKLSAKQINPLTGLNRIAQKRGSFIFASPKQDLSHLSDKNKKAIPKGVMVTGAITKSDYNTDRYMSERTANIADDDHILGALIVQIKNNKVFFARQVQFNKKTGAFTDLDTQYFADGTTKKVTADLVQFGDYHVLSTDPKAKEGGRKLVEMTNPDYLTVEDFFDGITINPHTEHMVLLKAMKLLKGEHTLTTELQACSKEIDDLCKFKFKKELVLKYGNHEDFLMRWLQTAEYAKDPVNHYEGVCLAKAALEGNMPFEYAMRVKYPVKNQDKIRFLSVDDSFIVNGVENGAHGHLGAGGKRNPNMEGVRNAYGKSNVGHNHSGAIFKDVYRAGTKTYLQLDYNHGPSAWTQSDVLQHKDGSRQLITYIDGEFTIQD